MDHRRSTFTYIYTYVVYATFFFFVSMSVPVHHTTFVARVLPRRKLRMCRCTVQVLDAVIGAVGRSAWPEAIGKCSAEPFRCDVTITIKGG